MLGLTVHFFKFCFKLLLYISFLFPLVHILDLKTITYSYTISDSLPIHRKFTIAKQSNIKAGYISTPDLIYRLATENGYSDFYARRFVAIAFHESTFNPTIKGYAGEFYGLLQIYIPTWYQNNCTGNILNPVANIRCGFRIQRSSGWTPWTTYTIFHL